MENFKKLLKELGFSDDVFALLEGEEADISEIANTYGAEQEEIFLSKNKGKLGGR